MIRLERDRTFWEDVARHPAVAPSLGGFRPELAAEVCRSPRALPVASEHGGYIFIRLDAMGLVWELHSLFKPEGWGREALQTGIAALGVLRSLNFQLITTLELAANPRSRPPLSFGFRPAGDFRPSAAGSTRLWALTRQGWEDSPAKRRHACL